MPTSLGFTGDVMLGRGVDRRQREPGRPAVDVWGDRLDTLRGFDGLLVNLECCLSERGRPWTRTERPFHFRASPDWATTALRAVGVDCCALANNHVLDYETVAFEDTLDALDDAGIAHAGAGRDLDAAWEPATFEVDGLTVAVVSLTDNTPEFAAAETDPGTAYVVADHTDPRTRRRVGDALARAQSLDPDLVVVSAHLGPNMVTAPSDGRRAFTRWLVESGADVVHGHSAHVFQGVSRHAGGLVLHDTGDLVDDYAVDDTLRNDRSFCYELVLEDSEPVALRLHPTVVRDCQVVAPTGDRTWWLETLRERSAAVGGETDYAWSNGSLVRRLD